MSGAGNTSKASGILRGWIPSLMHSWNIRNCIHFITAMWNDFKKSHHINHHFVFTKNMLHVYIPGKLKSFLRNSWTFPKVTRIFFWWHLKTMEYMPALVKKMVSACSGWVVYIHPRGWCNITYGSKFGPFCRIGAKKKRQIRKSKIRTCLTLIC